MRQRGITVENCQISVTVCTYERPQLPREFQDQQTNGQFAYSIAVADGYGQPFRPEILTEEDPSGAMRRLHTKSFFRTLETDIYA